MNRAKKHYYNLIDKWVEDEKKISCGKESQQHYMSEHKYHFNYLFNLCLSINLNKSAKILDIGRSQLSVLLSNYYNKVVTLGFDLEEDIGGHREIESSNIEHIVFDLNECKKVNLWPQEKFDIIVYSEVIEHLFEAPEYSLLFFKHLLNPGGFIICSTPNAASLYKRFKLLFGENPYEKIRFYNRNPGHFREYTKKELIEMVNKCELKLVKHEYKNFIEETISFKIKIFKLITAFIPSFKLSQIIVIKK